MAGLRCFGFALRPVFEAPAFVSGLDDLTVMCEAVEQRNGHIQRPDREVTFHPVDTMLDNVVLKDLFGKS